MFSDEIHEEMRRYNLDIDLDPADSNLNCKL